MSAKLSMVSEIFIFDFDRKMMKMMPISPIHASTFSQMDMGIDGVAPLPQLDFCVLPQLISDQKYCSFNKLGCNLQKESVFHIAHHCMHVITN